MDPHLLRTFVTVARHESFSVAAHELGYTQSAVSQQIAALEADLDVLLLRRRPVVPTDAGRRLLEHAGAILLRLDAARADVRRVSGGQPVELRVGISPMADSGRLVERLVEVQRSMPRVTVTVSACGADEVAAGVARGELEIGLVDGVTAPSDPLRVVELGTFTTVVVSESPLVVVLPRDHPLAARGVLRLSDLADARWIDAPGAAIPLARLRVVADGFRSGLRYDGAERSVLLAMVAAGGGLAVLPAPVAREGVAAVPLAAPALVHRTELVHGSLTGPAAAIVAGLGFGVR
ncbi:LysR family transcriptional regulator [Lentzea atacamensis]|uniref:LysR family transcriptional regulator n=1 Tax=Lentzea atacamensis TaxID=531938 RepID=UPI000D6CA70B|nr:LysR family transcriptional regulator [Lentzea atacamensis]